MTDLVQIREALEFISGGHTIPGYQGEHSDPRIAICQQVIHGAQTKAKEALVSLEKVADETEFMREVLQDHGRTLPHGKDECDWCSRELKETP